jgi:hypothetical protein
MNIATIRSSRALVLAGCTIHVQFLVAKRHPDLLFDPDTDTDPDPDFIRFPLSFSFRRTSLLRRGL